MSSIRVSLTVAAGLAAAAVSSHAQSATATISWVASGSSYDYTITLKNTGSVSLNGFWYGWTSSGNNLPSVPSNAGNSSGWGNTVSGNSIKWANSSYSYYGYTYYYGTSLSPGASATFTFVSSSPPSAVTASPSGESVAYVGAIDSTENAPGDSTAVLSPVPASPASPVPTATATIYGVAAGSSYNYTITLQNTGSNALNAFWYGWTTSGNNLPSAASNAANSLGWSDVLSGDSIMWTNDSGTALAPGASATFTFANSSSPSAITAPPSGESVAYVGAIDFTEGAAGDSTAAFSPALVSPPAPLPTVNATIYGVPSGSFYDYTITLQNTGTLALNSFWYGWTTGGDNLASAPSSAGNSLGWGNGPSGNSIMWVNNTGTALAPGASATFTFVSSSSPSVLTASPSGESVAYVGGIDVTEDVPGDSTAVFSPALVSPPPTIAVTFNPAGAGAAAPNAIVLAWPTNNAALTLQSTTNLFAPTGWVTVSNATGVVNGLYVMTNIISGQQQFFRLAKP